MKKKMDILEAQGELNREITAALSSFRNKIIQNSIKETDCNPSEYDISKEGSQKMFRFRQSLLTLKFQFPDYKTIYNMLAASLLVLMFRLFYDNYITNGEFFDMNEFGYFFRGWKNIFFGWWLLTLWHYSIILLVFLAMKTRIYVWMPLYVIHQTILIMIGISVSDVKKIGFACVFIILCEAVRMLMKSHSYFRTKLLYLKNNEFQTWAPKRRRKNSGEKEEPPKIKITLGDFYTQVQRFSYFFVCPTLIYRDEYTLTPLRSTTSILFNLINFMACIYYAFILYVMLCKENIEALEEKLDIHTFFITILKLMLPSVFFLLLGFFGFLHSWLNLWSEITRFPDRAFYSDWWNAYQFGTYYRKWNIVVHDWLYYYIYLDLQRFFKVFQKYKILPQLSTFFISAVIHEIIVCFAIGFFYPILFILFTGPGIILIKNQKRLKTISVNFMFWLEMYFGASLLFSSYLVESFARVKISDEIVLGDFPGLSFLIPRTLYLGQ